MAKDLSLKIVINGEDKTGQAFGRTRSGVQSISDQVATLQNRLTGFLALKVGDIISGQIGHVIKTADAYKTLEARLKLVSDTTSEFATAQDELFQIAQRSRGGLEATYTVYGKLETIIKQLGGTQKQALTTTETLNQAIALTSQGAAQDSAAILQFSQALGSGVLRGDEFNSVMENSPGLAQALADGLGVPINKLRAMAEAGELTADRLINALGKSSDNIAARFAQMPLTVGGAMTQLSNSFTKYIGEADKTSGATSKLANVIGSVAGNIKPLAEISLTLAEIYGAKLVLGLSKSTQGFISNVSAARAKAAADMAAHQAALALLQTEAQVAAVRVKSALSMVQEHQAIVKINAGTVEETAAKKALAQAINQLYAAQTKAATANTALNSATASAAPSIGKLERAFNLLNNAIGAFFAYDVGLQVGQWALQFEPVRMVGVRIAEAFTIALTGVQGFFSNISLEERWAQVKQIHAEYNQVAASASTAAQTSAAQVGQAETAKAQAIEAAAIQQQASFKAVQDATQALTASIDSEAQRQTAAIQQSLTDRLAAIDATNIGEAEKDTQRVNAKLAAYQQEFLIQQQASQQKLALIDQEYAAELEQAKTNAQRTADIETQKRQAKLAVYSGLSEFYQGEVNRLSQVYASEYAAAQQAKQQLQALNQSHQQALFNINLMGMEERQKLDAQQSEFDRLTLEAKKEQSKGAQADQEKINRLLTDAKSLHTAITTAAGNGSSEIYKAKERENKIYALQKDELEANAKAHEDNASRAKAAQDAVAAKLKDTQSAITEIADKLNQDYALKIGIDLDSLNAAQSAIAELTAPATKVITLQTVSAGGGSTAPVQQATGGLAGFPARFASGGYSQRSGKLGGFGGGDKIKALLEAGEFIVRKEAVQKLGLPFMRAVNAGDILRRARGGVIKKPDDTRPGYYEDGTKITEGFDQATVARAWEAANRGTMWETGGTTAASVRGKNHTFNALLLTRLGASPGGSASGGGSSASTSPKLNIPTPSLPSFQPSAPASASSPSGSMRIQFVSPKSESVSGQFSQSDATGLLRILKDSGAITV
jgi:tape measure domain-containing protein